MINLEKSEVSHSRNVSDNMHNMLREKLGFKEVETHQCYLGLPKFIGRSKKAVCQCVCDRVWKKLRGWKDKLLSKAGREVLIKAVVQSIATYAIQCFEFPKALCEDLEGLCRRFWWSVNID